MHSGMPGAPNVQSQNKNQNGHIYAKRPPKRLISSTFGIKIYWPKIMLECCPRTQIDALRPPKLIYASKTRI